MKRMTMAIGMGLVIASLPSAARAQAHQDFTRLPIEPFYAELEPGTLCDFSQAVESLGGTVIRIRIYDTGGNKVKAVLIGDETIRHTNLEDAHIEEFFGPEGCVKRTFHNSQLVDLQGLTGRMLSSSYLPVPGDPDYEPMVAALGELFLKHQVDGRLSFNYHTDVYYGRLT